MLAKNPFGVIPNAFVLTNELLSTHTTLRVGGKAKYFATPTNFAALSALIKKAREKKIAVKIIGNGSNLLVSDKGYNGLIISLKKFKGVKDLGGNFIRAYAGENLQTLINYSVRKNLSGLEELTGIPASVGGAVYQNAGAFSSEIKDSLYSVCVFTGDRVKTLYNNQLDFGYRTSVFQNGLAIILSATFKLTESDFISLSAKMNRILKIRKAKQPQGKTCGSTFQNPKGISAGALIDGANLKGFSVGGAKISEKHANFIINENGSAEDVYLLIKYVKKKVFDVYGVLLKEEVETVGDFI